MQIVIVLGLLAAAVALFAMEVFSVDIITLLLLLALVVTRVLSPAEAFAGFSNEIIIILAAIFVISGALQQTGAIDAAGAMLHRVTGSNVSRLLVAVMATSGGLSAFMNNTTATAVLVSPVMGLARRAQVNASKLLMPLAFGSIMGGTCTLIGTSTNIAVSGYIAKAGMQPLALFEIAPVGLILVLVGILYML
ncbi:MAG: potassium transporter TrkA, partial [Acidobacteria bacterium]|nr:potassium transporter TrkA [Acidobacteriota bacterium]